MPTIKELDALNGEMTEWRHALHQKPEMAFEEEWTSDFIAEKLESFGIEIHRGLAKTGIVGVVRGKVPGKRAIGLRADMDALRIEEANTFTHRSQHPGIMHACGHDGHSAMLLGAARHLAENPDFAGTVYLIFQPAEENEGGARVMSHISNVKPRAHRIGHRRKNQRAVPIHDGARCFASGLDGTNLQRYARHNARTPSVFFHPHFLLCSARPGYLPRPPGACAT